MGQGGDLGLNVNCPYNGADPVINSLAAIAVGWALKSTPNRHIKNGATIIMSIRSYSNAWCIFYAVVVTSDEHD